MKYRIQKGMKKEILAPRQHTIPVLASALRVIFSLAEDEKPATAKELSRSLGISFSTCYRILQTFTAFDWLRPGQEAVSSFHSVFSRC